MDWQKWAGRPQAFAPFSKQFLDNPLGAERSAHLSEEERQMGNMHNGKGSKSSENDIWRN
ncbi:hypothetical protein CLV98_101868 [Dyadobacter jejuensis]|uniref:Uncharacterized protein n=1 Tax=Dyadobacter jejuensis TaxID=1082580 RepID=A0A316ASK3_9BACT|nr:hypothetical protein [Dyadobacter jejuensis]PWJ60683.1 hypothetical protein CLV98_101868 [Dyadobacter jejuensis]